MYMRESAGKASSFIVFDYYSVNNNSFLIF